MVRICPRAESARIRGGEQPRAGATLRGPVASGARAQSRNGLVALQVDLIYVPDGTLPALAAKNATRTIPIVFLGSADPVGLGLVSSLSHPGGNLTGNSIVAFESYAKALQLLSEILGNLRRVAHLTPLATRSLPWFPQFQTTMAGVSHQLGVSDEYVGFEAIGELESLLKQFVREGVGAVTTLGTFESLGRRGYEEMAASCVAYKMPSVGDPELGFLLSYQPDFLHLARKSAEFVDRILRGERPADLPVEQTSTLTLVINQRTSQAIGLKIPQSLLLRADRLIQ